MFSFIGFSRNVFLLPVESLYPYLEFEILHIQTKNNLLYDKFKCKRRIKYYILSNT